jgi:IS5 family transposase
LKNWSISRRACGLRAKVEHPFHVVKNLFRHRKTRYRRPAKNTARLFTPFGFANLVLADRRFTITETEVRPKRRKEYRKFAEKPTVRR